MNKNSLYMYTNENTETCVWYHKGKLMKSSSRKSFLFMVEMHNIIHESLDHSLETEETLAGMKMLISLQGEPIK